MADALLRFYSEWPQLKIPQQPILKGWAVALMRHLTGDFVCDLVSLPKAEKLAQLLAGASGELIDALGAALLGHNGVKVVGMPVKAYEIPRSLLRKFA
jgi:hypothetical protein